MVKETVRKCIVSGKVLEKDQLLRFTITPEGLIIPDFKKKLPGKGVYVTNSKKLLTEAIVKGSFGKALKTKAKAGNELIEQVEHLLKKQALDAVSLSKKAGVLVFGLDKVLEMIKKDKVSFLLEALDSGQDGRKKIEAAAKDIKIFKIFKSEELDKELAKESTVYLAFCKSKMADMVEVVFERLTSFLEN